MWCHHPCLILPPYTLITSLVKRRPPDVLGSGVTENIRDARYKEELGVTQALGPPGGVSYATVLGSD
ncbi:hypothetical protein TNCV_454831 [Trichonephila clavipes]|nr:hypothetical protein TNCV_454831 [Trichonephila clavipes]